MGDATTSTKRVTEYFTGLASVYSEHRPTYPRAAIEWILKDLARNPHVADVGCGTGISTRLLAAAGARVIGIDPNSDMLNEARLKSGENQSIDYRTGMGEQTGLPSASCDLVVCAQSFHWFDAPVALREFHRILKPAGRLALMWNWKLTFPPGTRPDSFTLSFTEVMERSQQDAASRGLRVPSEREADPTLSGHFANPRRRQFDNPQSLDLQGVLGRARSASYFPCSGPLREAFERELTEAFHRHERDGRVILLHIAEVKISDRVDLKIPGRAEG